MRTPILSLFTLIFSVWFHLTEANYRWPDTQYEHLEGVLYEGVDMLGLPIASLAEGCKKRDPESPTSSSTVAAEWLRFAYHDMATFNISDGTGGMDASLYYELSRPENVGSGMISTMFDFSASSDVLLSRADLVALGAIWGIAACGGPVLPFRGGRKDASKAGRPGVPEPQQPLSDHTASFKLQGFTPKEMIGLVACGHTVGGVRDFDFPTIVGPGANASADNVQTFDSTTQFDPVVATEYLKGTTQNPLVVNANDTIRSDFRIFSSDRNATMRSLTSPKEFKNTCGSLLTRMIDTVPRGVKLTEEIIPIPFKVTTQFMFIDSQLVFDVKVRVLNTKGSAAPSRNITMLWCDRRGPRGGCAGGKANLARNPVVSTDVSVSPVSTALDLSFTQYELAIPLTFERSIGSFWFEVSSSAGTDKKSRVVIEDNGGAGYWAPDDALVFVPVGFFNATVNVVSPDGSPKPYYVVLGIHNSTNVSQTRVSAFDTTYLQFDLDKGPRPHYNVTFDLALNRTMAPLAGYNFYGTEILDAVSLALTLDFGVASPSGTKSLDFVVAKCAEFLSLGEVVPVLSATTETTLFALSNGTHRN